MIAFESCDWHMKSLLNAFKVVLRCVGLSPIECFSFVFFDSVVSAFFLYFSMPECLDGKPKLGDVPFGLPSFYPISSSIPPHRGGKGTREIQ